MREELARAKWRSRFAAGMLTIAIAALAFIVPGELQQSSDIAEQQHQLAELVAQQQAASLAQCQRGNHSRPQQIRFYLTVAQGNRRVARQWGAIGSVIGSVFPPLKPAIDGMADAHAVEAAGAHHSAAVLAGAQHAVARYPDAKSLPKRSKVDCREQFG